MSAVSRCYRTRKRQKVTRVDHPSVFFTNKELVNKEKGNFLFSPSSIKTLLALILEGAEGSTQAELFRLLRLPHNMTYARQALSSLQNSLQKTTNSKVTIDSVAQIFIAKSLKPNNTYAKTVMDYYKADISPQDFNSPEVATNNINSWIRTRTGALISDLVDEAMITPLTYAIFTSAIYFDGKWKTEFPLQYTKDQCFYYEPGLQCQMTPTMAKNEELYYKLEQSIDSHVLQIPYQDERFSMVVVMPRKMDGMAQLTVDVIRLTFPRILEKMRRLEVNLKMPRFSMNYGTELISTLEKVTETFSDNAQLPYMIDGKQSRVGAVVHKAKIDVSEKGTKAAAASAAAVVPLTFGPGVIDLELNHPFFYFVYDNQTKTVLFAGRLSSVETAPSGVIGLPSQSINSVPLGTVGGGNESDFYGNHSRTYQPINHLSSASVGESYSESSKDKGPGLPPGAALRPGSGVLSDISGPKPSNLGAVNRRYNPHAHPVTPPKRNIYKDIEYPPSTDDGNYAKLGSQSYRASH